MPRYSSSDIAHAASTDHRIVRRPQPPDKEGHIAHAGATADLHLAHFHHGKVETANKGMSRDLAIAAIQTILKGKHDPRHMSSAIQALESALVDDPDDLAAWEMKALGLYSQRRVAESLAAAETVLQKRSNRETALSLAATSSQLLGRIDLAVQYWRRAVALNPWMSSYRENLCQLLASQQDWQGALEHSRHWLRLDPANPKARNSWLEALRHTGYRGDPNVAFAKSEPTAGRDMLSTKVYFPHR
jgi:tetratricopeptide (TPR) repeat protein